MRASAFFVKNKADASGCSSRRFVDGRNLEIWSNGPEQYHALSVGKSPIRFERGARVTGQIADLGQTHMTCLATKRRALVYIFRRTTMSSTL